MLTAALRSRRSGKCDRRYEARSSGWPLPLDGVLARVRMGYRGRRAVHGAEMDEAEQAVVRREAERALDVVVVGVRPGQPLGAEALGVRRKQDVLRGRRGRQDLLDLGDLGVRLAILAATAISSGARSGRIRSCSIAASGASG